VCCDLQKAESLEKDKDATQSQMQRAERLSEETQGEPLAVRERLDYEV